MMNKTQSLQTQTRRDFLRRILGSSLFFGLIAANIAIALKQAQSHLSFTVGPASGSTWLFSRSRLYTTELLGVDWQRQIWYWPRDYLNYYWNNPRFFTTDATFRAEFHGVALCEGRVAPAIESTRVRQPTLRVLQLRSGPAQDPLLAGASGFAFTLLDSTGTPRFPCDNATASAAVLADLTALGKVRY
ncbi:MAG: hypothetical protein NTZ50_02535 [Chloroflexi bacterium]|nr:hypothetical protein [Chloroflexota bacterium]